MDGWTRGARNERKKLMSESERNTYHSRTNEARSGERNEARVDEVREDGIALTYRARRASNEFEGRGMRKVGEGGKYEKKESENFGDRVMAKCGR